MNDDAFVEDEIRKPQEVARRALALSAVVGLAIGAPRGEVLNWLETQHLREALTPNELDFVDNESPTPKQTIDFSWQSERLIVLLWALGLVESLPSADTPCDGDAFQCLPPFSELSEEQFISCASLRSADELWAEANRALSLHWQARDAILHSRKPTELIDIEIVQERHHAINWVTGYDGLDWDDITTDT